MSTDRDTTRIVRSWLEDGVTRLPDTVLDSVLDRLPTTSQRRVTWWSARRPFEMNKLLAFSAAAVAIVVVAIVGIGLFGPTGPNFGAPEETPIVTPTPEAQVLLVGAEGPGSFMTTPGGDNPDANPPRITFAMPEGWSAIQPFFIASESDENLFFLQPSGLYSDPCLANSGPPDISVGSTADELASALAGHASYDATTTSDVVIGGYDAIRMELLTPSDLDYTLCENGQFWVWDAPLFSEGPNRWTLWIIDLDGTTLVLLSDITDATAEQQSSTEQIVQTIRIDP
jgi:hypothetical protein